MTITVSLLQLIYFSTARENIQHSMLDNPDYNNISIENYKWEIFTTFILELHVYVTSFLIIVYQEVIVNIQC